MHILEMGFDEGNDSIEDLDVVKHGPKEVMSKTVGTAVGIALFCHTTFINLHRNCKIPSVFL